MLPNVLPETIAFWRMTIGGLILWLIHPFYKVKKIKNDILYKIVIAGIFLAFHFIFFFKALKLTTISNATLFGTMAPIFSIVYEKFYKKIILEKNVYIGLIICFLGSLLIHFESLQISLDHGIGNLYAILCSVLIAVTYNIGKDVRKNVDTYQYTKILFSTASFTLFIVMIILNNSFFNYSKFEYSVFLFLGIIPTILGHGILSYSLKFFPTTVVMSVPLGEPIIASFLGFLIFGEIITMNVFLCGILILSGLYFIINK